IGATGATGRDLLDLSLKDDVLDRVTVFARRDLNLKHDKLETHVIDFDHAEKWKHLVQGDVLFSCLGATRKTAGSKEAQWNVDFEYQYRFARAASENGVPVYVLVSAGFASSRSPLFYSRMKGKLEEAVSKLTFSK